MKSHFEQNLETVFGLEEQQSNNMVPKKVEGELVQKQTIDEKGETDEDFQYARRNIRDIIDSGLDAIDKIHDFATQSQAPRAFEEYTNLMKTLVESNKALLELRQKKKEIEGSKATEEQEAKVQNNTMFVGSSAELLEYLKNRS